MDAIKVGSLCAVSARFAVIMAALSVFLCSAASAEDYAVTQAYMHSFKNNVSVYSGVFALNKDVNLQTSTYFKYNIDLINPDFGEGEGDGDSVKNGSNSSKGVAAASGASSAVSTGGDTAKDTRHAFTAGLKHEFENVVGVEALIVDNEGRIHASPGVTLSGAPISP